MGGTAGYLSQLGNISPEPHFLGCPSPEGSDWCTENSRKCTLKEDKNPKGEMFRSRWERNPVGTAHSESQREGCPGDEPTSSGKQGNIP